MKGPAIALLAAAGVAVVVLASLEFGGLRRRQPALLRTPPGSPGHVPVLHGDDQGFGILLMRRDLEQGDPRFLDAALAAVLGVDPARYMFLDLVVVNRTSGPRPLSLHDARLLGRDGTESPLRRLRDLEPGKAPAAGRDLAISLWSPGETDVPAGAYRREIVAVDGVVPFDGFSRGWLGGVELKTGRAIPAALSAWLDAPAAGRSPAEAVLAREDLVVSERTDGDR